ncbi:hypothetical protein LTR47_011582 [Exophiala xenobiotica]|nr:hypothetical protein LTR92_011061 [Exophiala xenobiotica]KAK5215457.1 hypothetical protein LTR72_011485 [Exophiala xenobiotica]KAK5219279.1 hypothetical protein LTR47_011582 [Exophiala xenobiotica]KAK5244842.1 hypothetical protein LTS06_009649 [Exophiala xenobiotica]KAK5261144.1 hypothetical protein LTR40_002790 [Exophiala xenobiotica]
MVETVAARFAEVVVVLVTGGGKSLTFMVPMFLRQASTTVVVVPLVALKQDLVPRCWNAGIEYSVWEAHGDRERYTGVQLLFVTAEQAVRSVFREFLGRLDANRQLDRVVFDEAHLILTASEYRPKMALLRFLRDLRCQAVFLSATLPPILMEQFQQRMFLEQPQVIRDVTFRRDIHYIIRQQVDTGDFISHCVNVIQGAMGFVKEKERVIVYVNSREDARTLASELECESFYSDSGSMEEKEQVTARWRDGVHRVIVAASAFGAGVDYARLVAEGNM